MRKFIIEVRQLILPFNEPAKDLSVILNNERPAPLQIQVNELVDSVIGNTSLELTLDSISLLKSELERPRYGFDPNDEILVYADNLYFDREFFTYFWEHARQLGRPCQAVLPGDDPAWNRYTIPLSSLVPEQDEEGTFYRLELYYFPRGWAERDQWQALRIPSDAREVGYYNVPDSMTNVKLDEALKLEANTGKRGVPRKDQDLTHYLSARTCVVIQSWVHLFNLNIPLGVFSRGRRYEDLAASSNLFALKALFRAIIEQKQILHASPFVKVGKNCDIDPSAIIAGPTTIGDNCKIGAGAVIDNCIIGDNVTVANNAHLMLSVVGHNCFLPFRAALFMTVLMDNTIVAQNACLQMCVVGRNSFVGAGTTFTDFNLLPSPLKAMDAYGEMSEIRQPVMGSCVGHNVRLGAGMVVMPGRFIESDVILIPSPERRIINKEITFDMSDHLTLRGNAKRLHRRLYPRRVSMREEEMLEAWGT